MTRPAVLAALLVAPALAAAQASDGRYSLEAARCSDPAFPGIVTLEGDSLRFWETVCRLTDPVSVRGLGGATLYEAACASEGMEDRVRLMLQPLADGGLAVARDGFVAVYSRCGR